MAKAGMKPSMFLPTLCSQLQELQRQRVCNLKSRIMIENRLVSTIATAGGYYAGMDDKKRKKRFDEARKIIEKVGAESSREADMGAGLILSTLPAIRGFDAQVKAYEKEMERLAKQLPIYDWLREPEQRGFGLLSLAKLIGEAGDLNNYANPGKLWRRMGCAPFESQGKMQMPSTWRTSKPTLTAAEWEECGYSPRRRSIAYLVGEGLVKQNFLTNGTGDLASETEMETAGVGDNGNGDNSRETETRVAGPYRRRYDVKKAEATNLHDDWKPLRCHRHGMLLATKLLLKNLWIEWTGGEAQDETESRIATPHRD